MGFRVALLCYSIVVLINFVFCSKYFEIKTSVSTMDKELKGISGIKYCCSVFRSGYSEPGCLRDSRLVEFCKNNSHKAYVETRLVKTFKINYFAEAGNMNIDTFHHFCCVCSDRMKCRPCFINIALNDYFCLSNIVTNHKIDNILFPTVYKSDILVWFKFTIVPSYRRLLPYAKLVKNPYLPLVLDNYLKIKPSNNYINVYYQMTFSDRRCTRRLYKFANFGYSEARDCVKIVHVKTGCPNASVSIDNQCNWIKRNQINVDDYIVCRSPLQLETQMFVFSQSLNGLCNYNSLDIYWPAMTWYLNTAANVTSEELPIYLGTSDETYYFETPDTSDYRNFINRYNYNYKYFSEPVQVSFSVKMVCDDRVLVNDSHSLASDIRFFDIILPETNCHHYIQYNATHDICEAGLTTFGVFCLNILFKDRGYYSILPANNISFSLRAPVLNVLNNFTCNSLSDFGLCSLSSVFNNFGKNLTAGLNNTVFQAMYYFFNVMGANDSKLHFYHPSDSKEGLFLGNWITGIFGVLIKPFFDVFTIMIKTLLQEIGQLFILMISNLVSLFAELISPITKLLSMLWKLLISVIVLIESKFLLLEYTILFLFILIKLNNNNIFSLIVVVIVMIIFGIERKHPSLMLYFVNPEYIYINLSHYRETVFSWNYTLSYIDPTTNITLRLF